MENLPLTRLGKQYIANLEQNREIYVINLAGLIFD